MNKKIWITGASSGIGKALAIRFANEGWKVAASARRENLLKELSDKYPNIQSFPLDVTDSDKCKSVFKDILEKFENIEICVFGTGIHDPKSEKKFTSIICLTLSKFNDLSDFGSCIPVQKTEMSTFLNFSLILLNTDLHFSLSVTSRG